MRNLINYIFAVSLLLGIQSCGGRIGTSRAPATLTQAWASDNVLSTPESVLYDESRNVLYVSNINKMSGNSKDGDGFISTLTPDGKIDRLHWVTGLNDPKGMALSNNILYVTDVDEVVAISTQTGGILGRYKADKARFLNDVVTDTNGNVYISDSETGTIYQLRNGRISAWLESNASEKPNGLWMENENRMVVAFMGSGKVRLLDPETKRFTDFTNNIPSADGIVQLGNSDYLVSNWNGEVYYINQQGRNWKLLDTKAQKVNAADIAYAQQTGLLYIPTFNDNRVVAYNVTF